MSRKLEKKYENKNIYGRNGRSLFKTHFRRCVAMCLQVLIAMLRAFFPFPGVAALVLLKRFYTNGPKW